MPVNKMQIEREAAFLLATLATHFAAQKGPLLQHRSPPFSICRHTANNITSINARPRPQSMHTSTECGKKRSFSYCERGNLFSAERAKWIERERGGIMYGGLIWAFLKTYESDPGEMNCTRHIHLRIHQCKGPLLSD